MNRSNRPCRIPLQALALALLPFAAAVDAVAAGAEHRDMLPPVSVSGKATVPVEKSYRKMQRGIELFESARATLAPSASLRFKLLPRKPDTDMEHIVLEVIGKSFDYRVPVAPDHSFVLERDAKAWRENALVSTDRRRQTLTWRTEIRSPGLPPDTRRLGDLRLECLVGLEADLVSNSNPLARIADLFRDGRSYCGSRDARYLFFAERPLFSVTLVSGSRQQVLEIQQLYASASDDPDLAQDLPYCDCEVLLDRSYFLPLGDRSWPDDTRVEFEYMDDQR